MSRLIKLSEIASARSGDKGNHANIGVVAKSEQAFRYLCRVLTVENIQTYLGQSSGTRGVRFELPKVWAMNFVLYDALDGGASQSLRLDTQGKLLGPAVMEMPLSLADDDIALLTAGGWRPKK